MAEIERDSGENVNPVSVSQCKINFHFILVFCLLQISSVCDAYKSFFTPRHCHCV